MRKLILLSLLGVALGSPALHAAEKSGAQSFWAQLRSKIEAFVPQRKVTATNATGGVRGSSVSADDVYWKGEASAQAVAADELEEFKAAMKLTEDNNPAQAQAAFSAFIQKHPASPLRNDAEQALSYLKQ